MRSSQLISPFICVTGIGSIPDAVLSALKDHKDLGIHSEMFSDGVMDLVKCGALTNHEKSMHRGKIIGSFLIGSQKLYDFVHDNPSIGNVQNRNSVNRESMNSQIDDD
jgi:acyl-CoA hydrolase